LARNCDDHTKILLPHGSKRKWTLSPDYEYLLSAYIVPGSTLGSASLMVNGKRENINDADLFGVAQKK